MFVSMGAVCRRSRVHGIGDDPKPHPLTFPATLDPG
jgi:hypothetical protein